MEVKFNKEINVAPPVTRPEKAAPVQARQSDPEPAFDNSRNLDEALSATPDVRTDVVDRARDLVKSPQYPPVETMKKIARLLAVEMDR
jgi:hypothetical protein